MIFSSLFVFTHQEKHQRDVAYFVHEIFAIDVNKKCSLVVYLVIKYAYRHPQRSQIATSHSFSLQWQLFGLSKSTQ